jgi:hypothetical protein
MRRRVGRSSVVRVDRIPPALPRPYVITLSAEPENNEIGNLFYILRAYVGIYEHALPEAPYVRFARELLQVMEDARQ